MFAQSLEVQTAVEWKKMTKPKNMPNDPAYAYKKKGWTNWFDFLGKDKDAFNKKEFMSYKEAEKWIRENNIKSINQFKNARKPYNLPSNPREKYRNKGWMSWMHFFGKIDENGIPCEKDGYGIYRKQFLPFEKARKYLIEKGIKSIIDYRRRRPRNLPYQPYKIYKDKGWVNWCHFFGKENQKGRPKKHNVIV
jgi:hypothetical protein